MGIETYRDLKVWRKAMDLAVACYKLTDTFPKHELYGITAQIRRAAISIVANIAEGKGRYSVAEFRQHVNIAHGSTSEVGTCIILAGELGYAAEPMASEVLRRCAEVGRMLHGLRDSLTERLSG